MKQQYYSSIVLRDIGKNCRFAQSDTLEGTMNSVGKSATICVFVG